jgi:glycosyltransferase involved in cell wall biosynthesis
MKKTNLHIYPSPYKFETRINKEVNSILEMGLASEIVIVAKWENGLLENEICSDKIRIVRIKSVFNKTKSSHIFKLISTLIFNFRAFLIFRKHRLSHINCHSLWVLPLCVLIKKVTGAKLIYDAHELETERAGLKGFKQKFAKILERKLIPYADSIIVVGELIAEWYKSEYNRNDVFTIRNVPLLESVTTTKSNLLRQRFNISNDDFLFIYQGVINSGRGIEILLEAFKKIVKTKHLVIMGYGPLQNLVIKESTLNSNIHFMPAVLPQEISMFTSGADVGVFMVENVGLSYYWCLPNKFFEYLYCNLPVIGSDFPEMKRIINSYECGWTKEPTIENLISVVNSIEKSEILSKKMRLNELQKDINWRSDAMNLVYCFA